MTHKFEKYRANARIELFGAVPALLAAWLVLLLFCPILVIDAVAASDDFERARSGGTRMDESDGRPIYGVIEPYLPGSGFGDAMVTGTIGKPSTLIRVLGTDSSSSEISSKLFVGLLKFDKDLNVVPKAAEYYQVLDDGLRLRFKLRRGIKWSDGSEVDLDDVEYTYRMMIDPKTPTAYSGDYKQVREFRRLPEVDDWTFEVVYEKPFPRALMSWMTDILPRRALENEDLRKTSQLRNPVSSGPFRLKSWENGVRVTLTANPDYFEGRPNLDGMVYRVIRDSSTMFLELQAGKIDRMDLSKQQYVFQTPKPAFKERFNVYKMLSFGYTFMGYNMKSPFFSDARVRRAISMAVDKNDVVDGALFGQGVTTIGPYRPGSWPFNTEIKDYPHDPAAALALLAEAGWKPGRKGLLEKDGRPFSFTLLVNQGNTERIKAATILQSQLKPLGIEVKVRVLEWTAFINEFVMKGYFDAVILGWNITMDPDIFDVWHSSRIGGLNFINYANPEVDDLLEQARSTFNREIRKKCYDRIQEILHEEQPYCFLYVPYSFTAMAKRFKGIEEAPAGIEHNLIRWWVPETDQLYRNFLQP